MSKPAGDLPTIDLSECENEPIHQLELVQSCGCVVVVDGAALTIVFASRNTEVFLGEAAEDLLGQPLEHVLDPLAMETLAGLMADTAASSQDDAPTRLGVYARPMRRGPGIPTRLRATAHRVVTDGRVQNRLILDLESVPDDDEEAAEDSAEAESIAMAGLGVGGNLYQFLDHAVHAVAGLLDFDRVMVYQFQPDWSGEVVAEARDQALTPFLGLRYPASDIPSQARRLYLSTLLRVIPDVGGRAVSIARAPTVGHEGPLDLSQAIFRSVSSYHIEYLRNMGVGATLVTSLVVDGRLWGLIACHHTRAKALPWHRREAAARLNARICDRLADILSMQRARQTRRVRRFLDLVASRLEEGGNALDVLFFGAPRLNDVLRCDGVAAHGPDGSAATGNTPAPAELGRFLERAAEHATDGLYRTHSITQSGLFDDIPLPGCQGALVAVLSRRPLLALACFRDELVHEVHWGGDPNKPVEMDSASMRLSPRKSFNLWREEVRGQARDWEPWADDLMRRLLATLTEGRQRKERPRSQPPATTLDRAAMAKAVEALMSRFEQSARHVVESFDLSENGALLAQVEPKPDPRAGRGAGAASPVHDVVVACNQMFRARFDVDDADVLGAPMSLVLQSLGLPAAVGDLAPGRSLQVEWWSGEAGHRTLRVLRRGLFAAGRNDIEKTWILYVFEDITSFQRTQRALSAARTQALAQASGRAAFLSQMARDLREPLHAIQGFAESLERDTPGHHQDRLGDFATDIRSLSGSLLDLLNDLLDVARLEQGGESSSEAFDLTLMVSEVCQSLRDARRDHGISWDWHLPNERILIQGDARALRHAVTTLISSALRANPPHGSVMVRLTLEQSGEPRLSVRDVGLGLSEDDLMALRQSLDETTRGAAGGTSARGLSLALVRGLIDLHGGAVSVSSNPSAGTTVEVTLPRHRVLGHDNEGPGGRRR